MLGYYLEDVGSCVYRVSPIRHGTNLLVSVYMAKAWSFFKLLDADAGGSVEIEEFLILGSWEHAS